MARLLSLARIFDACGYHVVGTQEARPRKEGMLSIGNYIVVSSNSTSTGTHGCQLWFSTNKPIGRKDGEEVKISENDVTVVQSTQFSIFAVVRTILFDFCCLSAHAHTAVSARL